MSSLIGQRLTHKNMYLVRSIELISWPGACFGTIIKIVDDCIYYKCKLAGCFRSTEEHKGNPETVKYKILELITPLKLDKLVYWE